MKVLRRTLLTILCMFLMFSFYSCDTDADDTPPVYIKADNSDFLYGDILYGEKYDTETETRTLVYRDLTELDEGERPVYDGRKEDPISESLFFAVSPELTRENGGKHVLVMALQESVMSELNQKEVPEGKIVTFNTKNNKIKVIKDGINEKIVSLRIYGDRIIYMTEYGYGRYDIHTVDINGENYKKMPNQDKQSYAVATVHEDRIYYIDKAGSYNVPHGLYSCSLDFEDTEYLFDVEDGFDVMIVDGYYVYKDNARTVRKKVPGINKSIEKEIYDICKRSVSDISKVETVLTDVYRCEGTYGGNIYYWKFDPEPYLGYDGRMHYNVGTNKLYEYSVITGKTRTMYSVAAHLNRGILALNGEKLIVHESDSWPTDDYRQLIIDPETVNETVIYKNIEEGGNS